MAFMSGQAGQDIKLGFWIGVGFLALGFVIAFVQMLLRKA